MAGSASAPDRPLSGVLARSGVPIEDVAFCARGHITAPGWRKRQHYLQQRLEGGLLGGFLTCFSPHEGSRCGMDLEWVEDYGEAAAAAWTLGGAEAVYEMVRKVWTDSLPLEPR